MPLPRPRGTTNEESLRSNATYTLMKTFDFCLRAKLRHWLITDSRSGGFLSKYQAADNAYSPHICPTFGEVEQVGVKNASNHILYDDNESEPAE